MSLRFKPAVIFLFATLAILGCVGGAGAAGVVGLLPFQDTGASPPSHYGNGSQPQSELLQASDGNFYGTTASGGAGSCRSTLNSSSTIIGCGTIFRINAATGAETVLYSFSYTPNNHTAPDGANPSAGLIQGKDGALYGVAQDGGLTEGGICPYGCGTLFRITTTGVFTLLHQFCSYRCGGVEEGANPASHLVQTADGTLYGTTPQGGHEGLGTLFSATTSGVVTTHVQFGFANLTGIPAGALVVGQDGSTVYGATQNGTVDQLGSASVFSYSAAAGYAIIHSFTPDPGPVSARGALIFGPDGLLYGVTVSAGLHNGTLYSLNTTGGDFAVDASLPGTYHATGLLLGSDGMMYGTMIGETTSDQAGGLFVYNPSTKVVRGLVQFGTSTGGYPEGALIQGKDNYLYGSNALVGPSNSFGPAEGTLFRIGPPLP